MARLPYLEPDQVAPEYRDMLKPNTDLHKLLVNSPDHRLYCAVARVLATMRIDNKPTYEEVLLQYPIPGVN